MKRLTTMVLAAAGAAALAGTASAMPLNQSIAGSSNLLQNARVVCNRAGHCFETRRHVYRHYGNEYYGAYPGYAVPPAYGPRAYSYYDEGPGVGFSFGFGDWR